MTLHMYTDQPIPLPSFNFLHLTVSEIYPEQDFQTQGHYGKVPPPTHWFGRPPAHPDTMGENNTHTAVNGCGVKGTFVAIGNILFHRIMEASTNYARAVRD